MGKAKGEQEVDNKGGDDGDEAGQYQVPHRPPLDSHFTMLREKMVRMDEKLFAAESEQRAHEMGAEPRSLRRWNCLRKGFSAVCSFP